jgi:hypothetical protein
VFAIDVTVLKGDRRAMIETAALTAKSASPTAA